MAPNDYTVDELTALISRIEGKKVSRQRVSQLAQEHGWILHPAAYDAADVTNYLWSRWRRDLARKMGITIHGLVTHDEWDRTDNCPVCGTFAIWQPATPGEIANLDEPIYQDGWPWLCINGHSEKSRKDT